MYNLQLDAAVAGQFNNISNVRLANESGDVVATATTTDANTVKFTNLSNTTLIEKDASVTYKVLVDINSNVTAGNLRATIKADANPTYYANLRDNN
ncbi:hypothetical protein J5751_06530 [bacterium]|nr:hypothetical protein [bacterium]